MYKPFPKWVVHYCYTHISVLRDTHLDWIADLEYLQHDRMIWSLAMVTESAPHNDLNMVRFCWTVTMEASLLHCCSKDRAQGALNLGSLGLSKFIYQTFRLYMTWIHTCLFCLLFLLSLFLFLLLPLLQYPVIYDKFRFWMLLHIKHDKPQGQ